MGLLITNLNEKFEQHDTLNPQIWEADNTLNSEVEQHLVDIVEQYVKDSNFLTLDDIITARIVGSNASYNYTDKSDIDLHLVVDMGKLSQDKRFVQFANDGEKSLFNKRYDIELNGINVEVYVEDVNASAVSNGVYDLFDRVWIKEPQKIEADIDYEKYSKYYSNYKGTATKLIREGSYKEIESFINNLYKLRSNSLARDGESGDDNQVFKDLRAEGLFDKLKDRMSELKSKELSLKEGMTGLSRESIDNILDIVHKYDATAVGDYERDYVYNNDDDPKWLIKLNGDGKVWDYYLWDRSFKGTFDKIVNAIDEFAMRENLEESAITERIFEKHPKYKIKKDRSSKFGERVYIVKRDDSRFSDEEYMEVVNILSEAGEKFYFDISDKYFILINGPQLHFSSRRGWMMESLDEIAGSIEGMDKVLETTTRRLRELPGMEHVGIEYNDWMDGVRIFIETTDGREAVISIELDDIESEKQFNRIVDFRVGRFLDNLNESTSVNTSTTVNIRESLNKIDSRTYNKYDLLNLYEGAELSSKNKRNIAEMIAKNAAPADIQKVLVEAGEDNIAIREYDDETFDDSIDDAYMDVDDEDDILNLDGYLFIKRKTVSDSDGFSTDYAMYYDEDNDRYICIFGDTDLYNPVNTEPDAEFDTRDEADDWFNSYYGIEEALKPRDTRNKKAHSTTPEGERKVLQEFGLKETEDGYWESDKIDVDTKVRLVKIMTKSAYEKVPYDSAGMLRKILSRYINVLKKAKESIIEASDHIRSVENLRKFITVEGLVVEAKYSHVINTTSDALHGGTHFMSVGFSVPEEDTYITPGFYVTFYNENKAKELYKSFPREFHTIEEFEEYLYKLYDSEEHTSAEYDIRNVVKALKEQINSLHKTDKPISEVNHRNTEEGTVLEAVGRTDIAPGTHVKGKTAAGREVTGIVEGPGYWEGAVIIKVDNAPKIPRRSSKNIGISDDDFAEKRRNAARGQRETVTDVTILEAIDSSKDLDKIAHQMVDAWYASDMEGVYPLDDLLPLTGHRKEEFSKEQQEELIRLFDEADNAYVSGRPEFVIDDDTSVTIEDKVIENQKDAYKWLQSKLEKCGNTAYFPSEERKNLDKLIKVFGNTYFWNK